MRVRRVISEENPSFYLHCQTQPDMDEVSTVYTKEVVWNIVIWLCAYIRARGLGSCASNTTGLEGENLFIYHLKGIS